ncbi:hypothetical protein J4H86_02310 [Spiractinospora alimapuensis]|uniref:hypothetical protein n=1 Tax=Spiractinospora alimapuensis TaxID=2820884 RepID=UPI001F1DC1EF|nr:hypothetical protein [Spiractinospora alimapuensis]QVQ52686.1 hypothetical protein J4H86_02310 [Spiractinospora alimapuensis]
MTDVRAFRRACHTAARRTGGRVDEFRLSLGVTPNFHQGVIAYRESTVAVVCRRDSPTLAVAEPRPIDLAGGVRESGPLAFLETPTLATVLAEMPGFRVLLPSELKGPFDATAWPDIDPQDVTYWRPRDLGEALFNYWD